jgi:intracellular septation protein
MKFLSDFLSIILFFLAYKLYDIYVATAVAIAVSIIQISYDGWRYRKMQSMRLLTLGAIVIFGGLTLILQDRTFVMLKATIVAWIIAIVFLGSQFFGNKTIVERMMGQHIELPAVIWLRLNWMWAAFYILLGAANLYFAIRFFIAEAQLKVVTKLATIDNLAHCATVFNGQALNLCNIAHMQEEFWVDFKLFGIFGLTFIFVIVQGLYIARYIKEAK